MTQSSFSEQIPRLAREIAIKAGEVLLEGRKQGNFSISFKGEVNLVTSIDIQSEKLICNEILSAFPDHCILTEESTPELKTREDYFGPLWIIDPLDGTTNYAHGHLHSAVSIAFADRGVVQTGVVHCPFLQETYHAQKGQGAFLNDEPVHVTQTSNLKEALVGTGFSYRRDTLKMFSDRVHAVLSHCRDLRRIGAGTIDLCWLACGRLDAFYESHLGPWDVAAGALIAREAGAMIGQVYPENEASKLPYDINPHEILGANPALFPVLQRILQKAG